MSTLKQQILSGVFYTAIAKYSGIVISLGVTAVLARLLTPDDFGVVAIATVIIAFFELFTNIGISAAIIQYKELTRKSLEHIYGFTLWMGGILAILFCCLSWGIASYYDNETLRTVCQILSMSLFFSSAAIVPNTLFYRNKQFRILAFRTLFIQLLTGSTAVLAAYLGAGLYTLTIQPVLSSLCIYLVSLKFYPLRAVLCFDIQIIRKIGNYSLFQFLFNFINYFTCNLDKLLVGKYMGMNLLGYYEKSYRLMMLPVQNITYVITPVLHPILSDYQKDVEVLRASHEKMVHLLALIGFPLSVFLFFFFLEAIMLLFGGQWTASIPAFRILSLSAGIQLILSSSGAFYQSGGDTRSMFHCAIFAASINGLGLVVSIFLFHTLEAVSWAMLCAFVLSFIQCYALLYRKVFRHTSLSFYKQFVTPIFISALLGLLLYVISGYCSRLPYFASFCLKSLLALITLGAYLQISGEYDWYSKLPWQKQRNV